MHYFVYLSFAIILKGKRQLVALLLVSYRFIVTLNVMWLFLTVPRIGLQCVIVAFPDHAHLLFHSAVKLVHFITEFLHECGKCCLFQIFD